MKRNEAYLNEEELKKLVNSADNARDKLILKILANTGMRRFELQNIDIRHIKFDKKLLYIPFGKYGKERNVPLDDGLVNDIKIFIAKRKQGFLFESKDKRCKVITVKLINDITKKAGIKANIEHPYEHGKYINPHIFRHSFARISLKKGIHISYLSKILGHTSTAFTMDCYCKPSDQDISEEYDRLIGGIV